MAPPVKQEQENGEPKKAGEDRPPQGHGRGEEWWRREGEDMDNEGSGLGFGVVWGGGCDTAGNNMGWGVVLRNERVGGEAHMLTCDSSRRRLL